MKSATAKINRQKWTILIFCFFTLTTIGTYYFTPVGTIINCTTIEIQGFDKIGGNIYIKKGMSELSKDFINTTINEAEYRVKNLFGDMQAKSIIIISDDDKSLKKFGLKNKTGATTTILGTSYVVIGSEGLNADVIAHELTHSELHARIDKIKLIPTWFDEGLALQNDYRKKYSEEQWNIKTNNGTTVPPMKTLETLKQFYNTDVNVRILNYTLAKHEVSEWLKSVGNHGLLSLIDKVNQRTDFYSAYENLR